MMKMFAASPSAIDLDGHMDEVARLRAFQALVEVSALLGQPVRLGALEDSDSDSVASETHQCSTQLLARPSSCKTSYFPPPPLVDPSSVVVEPDVLQYGLEMEEESSTSECSAKPRVRFQSTVSVVSIPSHRDLSREVVDRLWTGLSEANELAAIHAIEWQADGKNWRDVAEEEDMIWDPHSGEYIHPATWEMIQVELMGREAEEWKRWPWEMVQAEQEQKAALAEEWKCWEALQRQFDYRV